MASNVSNDNITCHVSGKEEPRITGRIPFREPLKGEIAEKIGAYTWRLWLDQQLKIINEYRLNLGDPSSLDTLENAARQFLKLDGGDGVALPQTGVEKAKELGNLPGDYDS